MNQGHAVPEGAIGKVGMLVALKRVKGLEDGRLGIIQHAVGWVQALLDADRQVFAWQVLLAGEPAMINGHQTHWVIVADNCLLPVSQFSDDQLQQLLEKHEAQEIEQAVADVFDLVAPQEIDSPRMERALHLAFGQAMLKRARETVGVARVLGELGFWLEPPESQSYRWVSSYNGQEILMNAAPGMFGDWRIWGHSANARHLHFGERVLLNDWPRGQVVQTVLEIWEEVFGSRHIPQQLDLGWFYRKHQQDMRALEPATPYVYLDGEELRMALRWLREAYLPDWGLVGPPQDVPLTVEIQDGMLRLRTERYDLGVTVCSGWVDKAVVSLRGMLSIPPALVRGTRPRWFVFVLNAALCGHLVQYWPQNPKV